MEIKLGQKAKDKVTGFTGIIIGVVDYLYGCKQYGIVPQVKKNAEKVEGAVWFDEGRIEILGKGILPEEVKVKKSGGINNDAPKYF